VDEPRERGGVPLRLELPDVGGGPAAHDRHEPLDRLQHARDAAKCEGGGTERDDFPVIRPREPADDLDWIGRRVRVVVVGVETIERELQRGFGGPRHQRHEPHQRTSTYII